jgi:predicted O-methyltransferase YrrM
MNPQRYRDNPHRRHAWWHHTEGRYLPQVYRAMTSAEQDLIDQWYEATTKDQLIGEMNVPMASLLTGLVSGSNIRRVVQLGHYSGYSTLVLGMCLRNMAAPRSLWSVDISPDLTAYTARWVERAGLQDHVGLHVACSADPGNPHLASNYLGGPPSLVIVDSSHQYEHTMRELPLWWDALVPGGIMALHDISEVARQFDSTGQGGVKRALDEWLTGRGLEHRCLLANRDDTTPGYLDICGVGLIQKPEA